MRFTQISIRAHRDAPSGFTFFLGAAVLAMNTAHSISFRANQYVYSTPGLVVQSDNAVVCNTTFTNNSDASLKTDVVQASTAQAIGVLRAISSKVYKRIDIPGDSTRLGFIAQDFAAALPSEWANRVGHTEAQVAYTDQAGSLHPAKQSTLTLDYSRLVCVLWEANRGMLARLEALEAAAAS